MSTETANLPEPPEELEGEALLEWHRIVKELVELGTIDKTDRASLVLYTETWAVHRQMSRAVTKWGAVIKYPNGMTGQSPFYKTQKESAALLRVLLSDLGLTQATRRREAAPVFEDLGLDA